jgi:phosphoribosylpyrophosphate synthetase
MAEPCGRSDEARASARCCHCIAPEKRMPKLTVLSVAPALAEAMRRIHNGESVSALFDAD